MLNEDVYVYNSIIFNVLINKFWEQNFFFNISLKCIQLNGFKYSCVTLINIVNNEHLFPTVIVFVFLSIIIYFQSYLLDPYMEL